MTGTSKIFGNRKKFCIKYELIQDPDTDVSPLLSASWGKIELWVAGRNLTRALIRQEETTSAEVYLLPIAEWFVDNWDMIFHEERLPEQGAFPNASDWHIQGIKKLSTSNPDFDERLKLRQIWYKKHGLASCLEGFQFPDLIFRRYENVMELSWDNFEQEQLPSNVRLSEKSGNAYLDVDDVSVVIKDWCSDLIATIKTSFKTPCSLNYLEDKLHSLNKADKFIDRLKILTGIDLDSLSLTEKNKKYLESCFTRSDHSSEECGVIKNVSSPIVMFRSASPYISEFDTNALLELIQVQASDHNLEQQMIRMPKSPPISPEESTEEGYNLALDFRESLYEKYGVPEDEALLGVYDLESVILPELGVHIEAIELEDQSVQGAAIWQSGKIPQIILNSTNKSVYKPWVRRMIVAHELAHLVLDGEGKGVSLISNPWAPYLIERRANAFAVMLLAPDSVLVKSFKPTQNRLDNIFDMKEQLGVGVISLCYHLENRGFIEYSERETILESLDAEK